MADSCRSSPSPLAREQGRPVIRPFGVGGGQKFNVQLENPSAGVISAVIVNDDYMWSALLPAVIRKAGFVYLTSACRCRQLVVRD